MAKRDNRLILLNLFKFILILVAITIVSTTGGWFFPFAVSYIDLFLIATVIISVRHSVMTSQLFGMTAGILHDVFTGGIVGMHALSLMVIGYALAGMRQAVLMRSLWQQCLGVAIATITNMLLIISFYGLFNLPIAVNWQTLLIKTIFNTIAGSAILFILHKISSKDIDASEYEEH